MAVEMRMPGLGTATDAFVDRVEWAAPGFGRHGGFVGGV